MVLILSGPSCIGKGYAENAIIQNFPNAKKLRYYTTKPFVAEDDCGIALAMKDYAMRVQSGELVLNERRGPYFYAYLRDDLLKDDGVYIAELSPESIQTAREMIPESKAISFVIETSELDILRERMQQKNIPWSMIASYLDEATSTVQSIRENYRYYDASVVITKEFESKFDETVVSLFRTLVPAYS